MMTIVLILVSIIAYLISNKLYRNIFNPIFIFVGVNVLSIVLSLLQDFKYSIDTICIIFIMFISFLIGIILGVKNGFKRKKLNAYNYYPNNVYKIILILGFLYDIALIEYLHQLFKSYSLIDFFVKLNEVNAYVQSDEYKISWYSYVVPLGMPLFLLCLFYIKHYNKNKVIIIQCFLCVLYCLSPRRDTLFNLIIVAFFFFLSNFQDRYGIFSISKKIAKYIFLVGICIVVLMSVTQELLNKDYNKVIYLQTGPLPTYLNTPYLYISLNYPYLQNTNVDYTSLPNVPFIASGRLAYTTANKLIGTNIDTRSDFELRFKVVGNNFITNTAPILYYAILDLGIFFFIFFIILGFLSQRAYYSLNSDKITGRIIGSIWFMVLAMSFRGYLLIYITFILSLVYTLIISKLLKTIK